MDDAEKLNLEAIGRFVAASEEIRFESGNRQQLYSWVERVLVQHEYAQQGKAARGLLRRYIEKTTGLSRAQVTRLIARYTASGRVQMTVYRRRRFGQLYTRAGIELLASVDEARETLSGPATHPSDRFSPLGWFIRKPIGYGYIDAKHSDAINDFYCEYLNPYLNYHRPCAQADVIPLLCRTPAVGDNKATIDFGLSQLSGDEGKYRVKAWKLATSKPQ